MSGTGAEEALNDKNEDMQEVLAIEKVINAFFYYSKYGRQQVLKTANNFRNLPERQMKLVAASHSEHINKLLECIEANQRVLKMIVNYGVSVFGDDAEKALRMTQSRRPDSNYISKVNSTLRQIVREWSSEGRDDRDKTFLPVIHELLARFPENKANVEILLPGAGLGRLAWDLVNHGFSATGNEFSMFMLITSCLILNGCQKDNQLTIYPYVFDRSNSWSYADLTRPVTFPDIAPVNLSEVPGNFSMCAGSFMDISKNVENKWDVIVTAWFIDTANNVIDYIETIHRILKPAGLWINVGPLTYHFEDMDNELSIELPYDEIIRIVEETGFKIEKNERITDCRYTVNHKSMLSNVYDCGLLIATK